MGRSDTVSRVPSQDGLEWAICLTLLPSLLVVMFSPAYMYHNIRRFVYSQRSFRSILKTGIAVALAVTEAQASFLSDHYILDIPQMFASCVCLCFFCLVILLYTEHHPIFRAINLVAAFLAVDIIYDGFRAYAILSFHGSISPVVTASICQKATIVIMETATWRDKPPETLRNTKAEKTSILSIFRTQFRLNELPELDDELEPASLGTQFGAAWEPVNKEQKYCLWLACFFAFPHLTLAVMFLPFCVTAATFAQPFFMRYMLETAEAGDMSPNTSASLFAITTLIYGGLALSNSYLSYMVSHWSLSLRGGIGAYAIEKTMSLPSNSSQSSHLITVVSESLDLIDTYVRLMLHLYQSCIDTLAGIGLLYMLMGVHGCLILIPFICFISFVCRRSSTTVSLRQIHQQANQTKVLYLSRILPQLRDIKMTGLLPALSDRIRALQSADIETSAAFETHWVNSYMLFGVCEQAMPLVILGAAAYPFRSHGILELSATFPPLALANLLLLPMMDLPWQFTSFFAYIPTITALQKFLLSAHHIDGRAVFLQPQMRDIPSAAGDVQLSVPPLPGVVCVSDVSIRSLDGEKLALQKLNGLVQKSQLNMIVGSVGCGKSLLLKAMLGEIEFQGSLCWAPNQKTAYCAQEPWLPNRTIRDCIVSVYEFESLKYQKIVRACGLEEDFLALEHGDLSFTGSQGNCLSGGQRHRIALARALYSDASILILDDIFSSIDRVTARVIFARLFGKDGLIRDSQRTTILSTHSAEYLPEADQILAFRADGSLSNCESFFDLNATPATLAALRHSESFATDESEWQVLPFRNIQSETISHTLHTTPKRSTKLASPRSRGIAFLLSLLPHKIFYSHLAFTVSIAIVVEFPAIYAQLWVENNLHEATYLRACFLILVIHPIFHIGMYSVRSFMFCRLKARDNAFRRLLGTVKNTHISSLARLDHGYLLSRFVEDIDVVKAAITRVMQSWLGAVRVILNLLIASFAGMDFAIATHFFVATAIILQEFYRRAFQQLSILEIETKSTVYSQILEITTGLSHIRAFQWQESFASDCYQKLGLWQRASYFRCLIQRWFKLTLESLIVIAALLVTNIAIGNSGSGNQAHVALAAYILMHLGRNTCHAAEGWIELDTKLAGLARTSKFIESMPTERDVDALEIELPETWPHRGELYLSNVHAGYTPIDGSSHPVLQNISLKLRPGQRIGVVGRTGSGKTSLALTVLNSIPFTGSIMLDDIDISQIDPEEIRRRVTVITQHPVELPGTIRDNILPSLETHTSKITTISDDIVFDVLRGIGIFQYIEDRGGIDAEYAAMKFSQGQKQLLSLARAILHHRQMGTKLVIMDEATSNMDYDTDSRIQAIIQESFSGCTMLIIAHRVESLQGIDYLLELDGGKVAAMLPCSEAAREMEE